MPAETIGSVAVDIVGDYSQLTSDLGQAQQIAAQAGEQIAESFNQGAQGADALSSAVAGATQTAATFEQQIQALVGSGATLAEALAQVGATGEQVGAEMQAAGSAAESAASGVEALGVSTEETAVKAEQARDALGRFAAGSQEAGEASESASSRVSELGEAFLEIAGLRLSVDILKEFAAEAINVYAATEKATIALGLLTGDAAAAAETVEHLKTTAQDLAVPFENLVQMDQQMTAFGFSAEQTAEGLRAAADAAAATGASFETAAQALDRMALSGMAGSRQLVQLGLSAQDLADSMGVSVGEVSQDFKNLDESVRMDVLVDALQKFQGAAEQTAESTSGALTRLKNAWEFDMESLGKDLAPVVTAVANFYQNIDYYFAKLIITAEGYARSFAASLLSTKDALSGDFAGASAMYAAAQKADADMAASLASLKQMHDADSQATETHTAATQKNVAAEVAAAMATGQAADSVGGLGRAYRDFDETSLSLVDSQTKVANQLYAQETILDGLVPSIEHAETVLQDVINTGGNVSKALDAVNKAWAAFYAAIGPAPQIVGETVDQTQALEKSVEGLIGPMQALGPYTQTAEDILKKMGITVTDTGDAVSKLVGYYEQLETKGNVTLQDEDAAWNKISSTLNKMTGDQLPQVLALYDQHLAQIKALGASEGEVLQVESQRYQTEINIDAQTGKSATDAIIGLNNIKLQQQALIDSSQLWGNTMVGVEGDIIKGFENMGQSISQVIVEGGNMADAFKKIGEQIAENILTTIINAGLRAIVDSIITTVIPTAASMGSSVATSATVMQTAMHAATAAMTADFTALNAQVTLLNANITALAGTEAGAGGASGAGGAAGAAGALNKAGTGILGLVSVISQVVTAIASVVQAIEQAHTNTLLDRIEHNTRYLQIEAEKFFQTDIWDIDNGLLAKFDMIFDRLGDIWGTEQLIAQELGGAVISGAGGGSTPVTTYGGSTGSQLGGASYQQLSGTATIPTSAGVVSLPSVPSTIPIASPPAGSYSSAASAAGSSGAITFNIQAAQNPIDTAKAVVSALKTVSPKFGPMSS